MFDICEEYSTEQVKRHILTLLGNVYPLPQQSDSLITAVDDILTSENREGKRI